MGREEEISEFLSKIYPEEYQVIKDHKYNGNRGEFEFRFNEPQITYFPDHYLTPRGSHIALSQGCYGVLRTIGVDRGLFTPEELNDNGATNRLKITGLDQDFRKEIPLGVGVEGVIEATKFRKVGGSLYVVMKYSFGHRASWGEVRGMITDRPVVQANADILRAGHNVNEGLNGSNVLKN